MPRENRSTYDRRVGNGKILKDTQIRKKYKHAVDFGVLGPPNRENFELFKDKIIEHMNHPSTKITEGTYKKDIDVFHYWNEETNVNVMIRQYIKEFLSGWRLKDKQLENVKNRGAL